MCRSFVIAGGKLESLKGRLRGLGSAAVAFSAGVDSSFLLDLAAEVLGARVLAVTARSRVVPRQEQEEAEAFCRARGIRQSFVEVEELSIPGFADNPPDRCYLCKRELFGKIRETAASEGMAAVLEGSNLDDDGDYRPGRRALRELGVLSPLREAGLTKDEIRALSRERGLPTWQKPSLACLASRFPYGQRLTAEALARVERAERWLAARVDGLGQLRVRCHGDLARIEVAPDRFPSLVAGAREIVAAFRSMGFAYVSLDLQGYRTGSLNETLGRARGALQRAAEI